MNNPTGRLLDLMTVARNIPDQTQTIQAWATIFKCDESDVIGLFQALAKLLLLVDEAKQATQMCVPGDKTIYMEPFPVIESMLSRPSFGSAWVNYKSKLSDSVMQGLRFGSHALAFSYPEKSIDKEHIRELLQSLDTLLNDCISAELPQALKTLFVENLERLRRALLTYQISGPLGLQDELDRLSGATRRDQELLEASLNRPETRDLASRFFEFIGKVNDSVQIVQTGFALAPPLAVFLLQVPKG